MAKDELTPDDLRAALAQHKVAPVYLFHGEEDFLVEESTNLLIASTLTAEHRGFNLDIVYGSDTDARDVLSHATSFPMMAERRVVVVKELDKLSNKEILASYIDEPLPSTCLVLQSVKPDFRKKPYVTARRAAMVIKCDPIRDYHIAAWIGRRVTGQGREIDGEAARILAAYVSPSLREIQNELDKLYVFVGEKRSITSDDVRSVVGVSKEYNVFELQNMIGAKDLPRSTEILSHMLDAGESPIMIVVLLTRYFSTLWKLHELRRQGLSQSDIAGSIGVNPYFIKNYVAAGDKYPVHEIEQAFEILASTDERLKSSSTDQFQVMHRMLLYLMKQGELIPA